MILKNKTNLSVAIFIILVILIIVFVVSPTFKDIRNNSQELISGKEKLASLESKIGNLNKLKATYKEFEPKLAEIDELFVNSELPVEFISFLEKIAKDIKVDIKISPAPLGGKDTWSFISFQISAISSFPNFLSFLEKLETAPYLIEIQNLNISQTSKTEVISANLSIKVYTR